MPTQALSFATSAGYRWTMSELATLYDQRIAQGKLTRDPAQLAVLEEFDRALPSR